MAAFPEMPSELRNSFPTAFWNWWQAFSSYLLAGFTTQNDVEVTVASKGVILKSPDGTRWRVAVNNAGTLTVTSL